MKILRKSNAVLFFILILFGIYGAIYIYKTSFVIDGERYFVLFDDAMISMRYARNLARGLGPVWNPGERVEGYTNPLWMVYMAVFHLLPVAASKMSLFIQVSGAIFLGASLIFVKRIAEMLSGKSLVGILAVVLTAFYYPLIVWSMLGMEVSILVLMTTAAAWLAIRTLHSGKFSYWLYLLLGVGTLVRVDMAVPFLTILAFMAIFDPTNRKQHLLWGFGSFVFFLAGQTLFRLWYYGDPLPNTYYLKMTGYPVLLRLERGLYVFFKFIWNLNWALFLLPFVVILFRLDKPTALLALVFLGQVAYSIYVGGDAWEHQGGANRYISVGIPLFFILFSYAVELLRQALLQMLTKVNPWVTRATQVGTAALVLIALFNFNALLSPLSIKQWFLLERPMFTTGGEEYTREGVTIHKITTEQATIAVIAAGSISYFSDRYALDLLGKSDRYVAHLPANISPDLDGLVDFRPGHNKWDYPYTIGLYKPDVIIHLWGDTSSIRPLLDSEYIWIENLEGYPYLLRKDSPNIKWDLIPLQS